MGLYEQTKNVYLAYDAMRRAKYECKVCGAKDLSYDKICPYHYIRFNDGDPSCWITMEGEKAMIVCSEECRKQYVAKGMAPYTALMKESWEGEYIIPKRHIRDPYCELRYWEGSESETYRKVAGLIKEWMQKPITHGWLMTGTVGTGKTSLACCIAYEFRKLEKRVRFVSGAELKEAIDVQTSIRSWDIPKQREVFLNKYFNNDLLIIDEINEIDWQNSIMKALFMKLHSEMKTVIFTTNLSPNELKARMDDFQYSRLIQMTKTIPFMGDAFGDLRK